MSDSAPPTGGAAPAAPPPPAAGSPPPTGAAPSSAPPAEWHSTIITKGADGKESLADPATWLDKAPEPLRKFIGDNMSAARAKTEGMVKVPGETATPEEQVAFRKSIGVPDDPTGYGIKAPEKLPDGVAWDEAMGSEFATVAHQIGLTPKQVAALQEFQVGYVGKQVVASRAEAAKLVEAERAELVTTFGTNLEKTIADAKRVASENGVDPKVFDPTSGDFWGVEALKFVSKVAAKLAPGGHTGGAGVPLPNDYAEARRIATDKTHPLYERYQKGDPEIVEKVRRGYASGNSAAA